MQKLITRVAAEPLGQKLRENSKKGIITKLNFKGIKTTDASFVDECIARVVFTAGEENFNRKVSITNTSKQVKEKISYVIDERRKFYLDCGFQYNY